MNKQIAFLSEWGNEGLDFSQKTGDGKAVSTHFVIAGLVINREDIAVVEKKLTTIAKKHWNDNTATYFQENLGSDHHKTILKAIVSLPIRIFALIVDKKQLAGEGIRFKGSVHKFLFGLTDRTLFEVLNNLDMVANPTEPDSFLNGFRKYVAQHHIPDLFNQSEFGFVNMSSELISKASDFMADALARCYDATAPTEMRKDLVGLIQPSLLTIRFWPDVFAPYLVKANAKELSYNEELANVSVKYANDFIRKKGSNPNPQIVDQLTCLNYLIFHFRHISLARYISSFELMEHIKARRGKPITLHYFQTKVIAPLRDAGVLIASSSRGYKLPASESDLYDFINHSNTIVEPMLGRIKKFRNQVSLATNGRLDILNREEYTLIRKVLD